MKCSFMVAVLLGTSQTILGNSASAQETSRPAAKGNHAEAIATLSKQLRWHDEAGQPGALMRRSVR